MDSKKIDLSWKAINTIVEYASTIAEIEEVVVVGSRVLGNAKKGSDVDLALVGSHVTPVIVTWFYYFVEEETLLPYFFDIVHFESITHKGLKKHIYFEIWSIDL